MTAAGPVPALSVIVPALDEGPHVRAHLARIVASVERLGRPFEVLLVDDGSADDTGAEARAAAATDPRVRVVTHPTNRGKGAALATGCAEARGDVLVFLDADLEISPDEIGPLLARLEASGAAVAVGSKYAPGARERRPWHRAWLSRAYLLVTSVLFRLPIRDTQTGLKALRRDVARALVPALRTRRWAWDVELLVLAHRAGARIVAAPVTVDFRRPGVRIGLRGFVDSGLDTVAVFLRDRGLGAYGRAVARAARGDREARSAAAERRQHQDSDRRPPPHASPPSWEGPHAIRPARRRGARARRRRPPARHAPPGPRATPRGARRRRPGRAHDPRAGCRRARRPGARPLRTCRAATGAATRPTPPRPRRPRCRPSSRARTRARAPASRRPRRGAPRPCTGRRRRARTAPAPPAPAAARRARRGTRPPPRPRGT